LVEEWAEAEVLDEVVLAAVGVFFVGGVLPEPLDVFARGFIFGGEVGGVDLGEGERGREGEGEEGGELEEAVHLKKAYPRG
jgi:hypothetical protein